MILKTNIQNLVYNSIENFIISLEASLEKAASECEEKMLNDYWVMYEANDVVDFVFDDASHLLINELQKKLPDPIVQNLIAISKDRDMEYELLKYLQEVFDISGVEEFIFENPEDEHSLESVNYGFTININEEALKINDYFSQTQDFTSCWKIKNYLFTQDVAQYLLEATIEYSMNDHAIEEMSSLDFLSFFKEKIEFKTLELRHFFQMLNISNSEIDELLQKTQQELLEKVKDSWRLELDTQIQTSISEDGVTKELSHTLTCYLLDEEKTYSV